MDLNSLDILTAARLLREGRQSSLALTDACLSRIAERNAELNAFVTVTADTARADARRADEALRAGRDRGPLHGIPLSLKDIIDLEGVPTTAASRVTGSQAATRHATVAARLLAAGAVIVGKCNLHEFALGTTNEDSAFGPARHPLDPRRSPGGSSGGSAVATATGMSLASIGSDTGGSIRIPAAACGLVGLKPQLGEVPTDGVVPLSHTLDHVGPLARTVADAAVLYQVLANLPTTPLQPCQPDEVTLGALGGYFAALLEPAVRGSFDRALVRLGTAGVRIREAEMPHADLIGPVYLHILLPEAAAWHARFLDACADLYTRPVRVRLEMGRMVLAEDYVRACAGRDLLRWEVDAALSEVDALVLPTLPIAAPELGAETVDFDGRRETVRNAMLRLTQPFNLSGHPAITLPIEPTPDGLPCGLQLVGHRDRTGELLALAAACEAILASRR
jgi:aspartyl-tRNA(Asn)/glutamyl-tRNA(Gln) amidotransferase subunit A